MNVKEFWEGVLETEAALPSKDAFALVSVENREKGTTEGSFVYAGRRSAAKRIFGRTHRLATPKEIEAYERDQERIRHENAAIEVKAKQHFALPPDLAALVEMAIKGAVTAPKEK